VLSDTDHLWGIGGDVAWVWKSFLRGLNPIFMDPYKGEILSGGSKDRWEPVRVALGQTRRFAERISLAAVTPQPDLASTGYCLAQPAGSTSYLRPNLESRFPSNSRRACTGSSGLIPRMAPPRETVELKLWMGNGNSKRHSQGPRSYT